MSYARHKHQKYPKYLHTIPTITYSRLNVAMWHTSVMPLRLSVYQMTQFLYFDFASVWLWLVFRKSKDLYLIITQKLTFMKSGGFQVKSTHNLIKSDVSTKTLQFGGCMEGAMTPDFMKSRVITPFLHSSNWIVLVETPAFTRFWVDFTWNPPDFMQFHEIRRISCIERPTYKEF